MLHGNWAEWGVKTEHPVDATVAIETGGRRWRCDARADAVDVAADSAAAAADATVSGQPATVFLWLWGRVGDDAVSRSGDAGATSEFRQRLVECAQ
jgi:hypothetical protein